VQLEPAERPISHPARLLATGRLAAGVGGLGRVVGAGRLIASSASDVALQRTVETPINIRQLPPTGRRFYGRVDVLFVSLSILELDKSDGFRLHKIWMDKKDASNFW